MFKVVSGTSASLENFIGSQTHIDAVAYANTLDDRPMVFVQTDLGYYTAGREFLAVREGDLVLQSCMNLLDNFYSCTPGNFFTQSSQSHVSVLSTTLQPALAHDNYSHSTCSTASMARGTVVQLVRGSLKAAGY